MKDENLKVNNSEIFQKIFGKKGNESILKDFVSSILDAQMEKIELQEESILEHFEKYELADIEAIATSNGIRVSIKIHINNYKDYVNKSMYYLSEKYLTKCMKYNIPQRIVSINIVEEKIFEEGFYHEIARLRRTSDNELITDKLVMHILQIPKFIEEQRGNKTGLDQWMQFISQQNEAELELATKENKEIKKANEEYKNLIKELG